MRHWPYLSMYGATGFANDGSAAREKVFSVVDWTIHVAKVEPPSPKLWICGVEIDVRRLDVVADLV